MISNKQILQCVKRRKTLASKLKNNSVLILPNKGPAIRSNDVEYRFKSDPDFFYLTGIEEENSICVILKNKKSVSFILFLEEKNPEKEIWVGKKIGTSGAKSRYKADEAYPLHTFKSKIKDYVSTSENIYMPIGRNKELEDYVSSIINNLISKNRVGTNAPQNIIDPRKTIHEMRLYKDSFEIECLQKSCDIASEAHMLAMSMAKPGMYEYELEALVEYKFKELGAYSSSYTSIVGSGQNACILHYINNNKKIKANELILIDAGCEFNGYASDLTRTFPSGKKFTSPQKDIYEIVLESQLQSIKTAKKGNRFIDVFNKSISVIVDGLKDLKLLKGSKEEIIKKKKYKEFYMHNIGHWLGLDVHDAGTYKDELSKSIKLEPGMVMTVEPGIYISNKSNVPKHFRGIGIRIEDDILITNSKSIVLTSKMPKKVAEIEAIRGLAF